MDDTASAHLVMRDVVRGKNATDFAVAVPAVHPTSCDAVKGLGNRCRGANGSRELLRSASRYCFAEVNDVGLMPTAARGVGVLARPTDDAAVDATDADRVSFSVLVLTLRSWAACSMAHRPTARVYGVCAADLIPGNKGSGRNSRLKQLVQKQQQLQTNTTRHEAQASAVE